MMNGIIIVEKEKGFTSHDVVAKMRGILHRKKSDIRERLTRRGRSASCMCRKGDKSMRNADRYGKDLRRAGQTRGNYRYA